MNQETGRLDRQDQPLLDTWAEFALEWVLPVSLAVVMAGQIFFSASKYHLGIDHPAWPFWGALVAAVGLGLLRAVATIRLTRVDVAMLAFVAVLSVSFLFLGSGSGIKAITFISSFILLPYLAGRMLDEKGINRFILVMSWVALLAFPLIGFGVLSMDGSELSADRVSTLFADLDTVSHAGVSTIPHASVALGLLLILLTAYISFAGDGRLAGRQLLLVAFMCSTVWMLVFLGLRSAILVALMVSAGLALMGQGPVLRRITLLLILLSAAIASWATLPVERKNHFSQITVIKEGASRIWLDTQHVPLSAAARQFKAGKCEVYGNAIATRVLLYDAAFQLFLDSPLIGSGAGNYGARGYCNLEEDFQSPHSVLLQTMSELGLVGAIAYLSLIGLIAYGTMQIIVRKSGERKLMVWALVAVWSFFFLQDQLSGNYFTGYHFFAITGVVSGLLATLGVPKVGGQ